MLVGLINPSAGRGAAVHLAHVLALASARLRLVVTDRPEDIDALVASLRTVPAELLVVAGGDGTLSHLLTRFDAVGGLDGLPPILVLPAGRVNTVAGALVGSRRPAALAQRILLAWTRGVRRLQRVPVLRVSIDGVPVRVGLNVMLGAFARLHADYRTGHFHGKVGMAELVARCALRWVPADRFAPIHGPCALEPGPLTLTVITAGLLSPLPSYFGLVRPFPGVTTLAGEGFHALLSSLGPLATQAALPGLLRGIAPLSGTTQTGEHTRFSWRNGPRPDVVVVDGEETVVPADTAVEVRVAARVRMLVWRELPIADAPRP
ncbi:MAG: hypothetical protein EXR79_15600 [Myxococcales bacterium]|nr:hypothetical protein [Myxococcales bacterium]